jgi:hypothetical protein
LATLNSSPNVTGQARSLATVTLENLIMTKFKLEEHLMFLLVEDKLCFEEGDWERLEQIRLAIDDTREQIEKIKS